MVARVVTVAFDGVEARRVDVEVQLVGSDGPTVFNIVGLPDKAVAESKERVRGAFAGVGLALPAKRIIANLAPADLPKEGSHFDLPIALALMAAMGVIGPDALDGWAAIGELGLDGQIARVGGALPAAVAADALGLGLICPEATGPEAAWAGGARILAPRSLIALINHFKGSQVLRAPEPFHARVREGVPVNPVASRPEQHARLARDALDAHPHLVCAIELGLDALSSREALREALLNAQFDLASNGRFPVIIVIGGVDGAGKGETVNLLNEWMDPRNIRTLAFAMAAAWPSSMRLRFSGS